MSQSGTTRDRALDFLKGAAIIMVVFFHNVQLNPASITDNLFMMVGNTAVPCFFLVSGALFFSRPFDLRKHIFRIVNMYTVLVCWRMIYFVFYHHLNGAATGTLREFLSYLFLFGSLNAVSTGHLWFIDAMLTVLLAAPLLRLCREYDRRLTLYTLAVLFIFNQLLADGNLLIAFLSKLIGRSVWDISGFGEINPFSLHHSNYMFYYLLGAELYERRGRISVRLSGLLCLFGLIGLDLIKYIQTGSIRWGGVHLTSGYYWCSTIVFSCGAFLLVQHLPFKRCAPLRWFASTVGGSSLGVFYLHLPLISLLTPYLFEHLAAYNGWPLNLCESLLITAVSVAVTLLCRKIPLIRRLF
ncbi:MAG: acyltransferase [Clostridiales bacterium]|nr:acyltransferase [Clostridiales bacterium]